MNAPVASPPGGPPAGNQPQVDQQEFLYSVLTRHYDLEVDRRKALSDQASSLITFAGVIEAIFVGLLIPLTTSPDARKLLSQNPSYPIISQLLALGYAAYLVTAILAVLSYVEVKWTPAPQVINGGAPEEWRAKLDDYSQHPEHLQRVGLEMQLITAIVRHRGTNRRKYWLLVLGYASLTIGIFISALTGYYLLSGIV